MSSSLKPPAQFSPDFIWGPVWKGYCQSVQIIWIVLHYLTRWPPFPCMVTKNKKKKKTKTRKHLLLRNQENFEAESWYIASETQGLPNLVKWWVKDDLLPFYDTLIFCPNRCGNIGRYAKAVLLRWANCGPLASCLNYGRPLWEKNISKTSWDSIQILSSRKHAYIILTPLNPTFI